MARRILAYAVVACAVSTCAPSQAAEAGTSPTAAYRAYAIEQANMLVSMTRVLAKDIAAGDVAAAQNEFASTHRYLERIRPLVRRLQDLERRIDASDDAVGFRPIERALYVARSTAGLAPVAEHLVADARELRDAVATMPIGLDLLVDGPAEEIADVAARTLSGEDQPYAKAALWDLEAGLDGAQAMVASLPPHDPLLASHIATAFSGASTALAAVAEGCGYKSFDMLSDAERARLHGATTALARELTRLKTTTAVD